MDYNAWKAMQVAGDIIKPIRYHLGEFFAMDYCFGGNDENKHYSVLDVGCGIGYGVGILKEYFGFKYVLGIDVNKDKIDLGRKLGANIRHMDLLGMKDDIVYDIIWCSHAFEHMYDPDEALEKMMSITTESARFFFILPYPDLNSSPVHHSAPIIGTNVDDDIKTLTNWFRIRGLKPLWNQRSTFREPEVWLEFCKR